MRDLAMIEAVLRDRQRFFHEIRDGVGLQYKARAVRFSSLVFFDLSGAAAPQPGRLSSPARGRVGRRI